MVGRSSGDSATVVSARAQIAAAARVKMPRLTRLRPQISTIAGTIMMSLAPTKPRTSPLASVETMIFGTPSGRARIAAVPMEVPRAAAHGDDRVQLAALVQRQRHRPRAGGHRRHGGPAIVAGDEVGEVGGRRGGDLGARDRGCEQRLSEHADVDDERPMSSRFNLLREELEVGALRIEGAHDGDGSHMSALPAVRWIGPVVTRFSNVHIIIE